MTATFPALPADLEPTRRTLHLYAHAVGAVTRSHAVPHPRWWHIGLTVRPTGLATEPVPLPDGGTVELVIDPRGGRIQLASSRGDATGLALGAGTSAAEMGNSLIDAASRLGLAGDYDRSRFDDDEPRGYDHDVALRFLDVLVDVDRTFARHRSALDHGTGPILMWPHGFDLAFEWFGTRLVTHEEGGDIVTSPAQLNLGFYPAGRAYFYSNPWPFDAERLVHHALPVGAEWHRGDWEGSILWYDLVADRPDGPDLVLEYARAVHEIARPTLTA